MAAMPSCVARLITAPLRGESLPRIGAAINLQSGEEFRVLGAYWVNVPWICWPCVFRLCKNKDGRKRTLLGLDSIDGVLQVRST